MPRKKCSTWERKKIYCYILEDLSRGNSGKRTAGKRTLGGMGREIFQKFQSFLSVFFSDLKRVVGKVTFKFSTHSPPKPHYKSVPSKVTA